VVHIDPVLQLTDSGLYCAAGDFYVDPWRPVPRAIITHAHSDHARTGSASYLCSASGAEVLKLRIGAQPGLIESQPFGHEIRIGDCDLTFFPAGHILGSAQIRIRTKSGTWVVSGDHNATHRHPAAEPFEPVQCDVFITESTFGLPIYRWPDPAVVQAQILDWWTINQNEGVTSLLYAYPLGKTQRLLNLLVDAPGPVAIYGNGSSFLPAYYNAGVPIADTRPLTAGNVSEFKGKGLVIVSASIQNDSLLQSLGPTESAMVSGWLMTRASRNRSENGQGFTLSDHSDWDGLMNAIRLSGAHSIGVTHGNVDVMVRYLLETGCHAFPQPALYSGDTENAEI
jgi:putative mRNA 3-end processing factor